MAHGRVIFPDMPIDKFNYALQSALRDRVFSLPPESNEIFADRDLRSAWDGNHPELVTALNRTILRFRNSVQSNSDSDSTVPPWFDVVIEFGTRELLVRTSHPRNRHMAAGIRVPLIQTEQWRMFIEGERNTGVAILIPRTVASGQSARSLIVCPRYAYHFKRGRMSETALVDSGYRLERTLYAFSGSLNANVLSSGKVGVARGWVLTTPNVQRSRGFFDEAYGIDPRVSLNYLPITTEQVADVETDGSFSAGIQLQVELQRLAGFKRNSMAREVMWIKQFDLTNEQPWFVKLRASLAAQVAPGACYLLLTQKETESRFTRGEFSLPERLQGVFPK